MAAPATVLVTGATDGIGLALVRLLAARGDRVIAHGRQPPADAERLLAPGAHYVAADLARPDAAARVAAALDAARVDALDVLIHNAATGTWGDPVLEDDETSLSALATNLRAPIELTRVLLPRVLAARGRIVFVSSVLAALPAAKSAVYTASKAGLEGFARSLRVELRGRATVTVVRPGGTRTGMQRKAGVPEGRFDTNRWASADEVAAWIVRHADRGSRDATHRLGNRVGLAAGRHARRLVDALSRRAAIRNASDARDASAAPHLTSDDGPPSQRRALVTGFADGIGRAVALLLAETGHAIVGADVDQERSSATAAELSARGAAVSCERVDLSDLAAAAALGRRLAAGPGFDVVVLNAGISAAGRFERADPKALDAVLRLDLESPILLAKALLRGQGVARGGTIVVVSSLSHYVGYPGAAVYAASKDALASWARSLAVALAPRGVRVLRVFPGPTRTAHAARYAPAGSDPSKRMDPARLARQIERAISRRATVLVPGAGNRVAAGLGVWLPRLMDRLMDRVLLRRLDAAPPGDGAPREERGRG